MASYRYRRFRKSLTTAIWFTPLAPVFILWAWIAQTRSNRQLRARAQSGDWPWLDPKGGPDDLAASALGQLEAHAEGVHLRGTSEGCSLSVRSGSGSDRAVIELGYRGQARFELSTRAPDHGRPTFELGTDFDDIFRTRHVGSRVVEELRGSSDLPRLAAAFVSKHLGRLQYLMIDETRVYCRLSCGEPLFPRVPPAAVDAMVPELMQLAKAAAQLGTARPRVEDASTPYRDDSQGAQ